MAFHAAVGILKRRGGGHLTLQLGLGGILLSKLVAK